MNPEQNTAPTSVPGPEVGAQSQPETQAPAAPEMSAAPLQSAPAVPVASTPGSIPAIATHDASLASKITASIIASPLMADDTDLIEKEWVLKAKQIVEETKTDPYVQSQQVNRMKADYMKKRYDKDIKLEETAGA